MATSAEFAEALSEATGEAAKPNTSQTTMVQRGLWALASLPVLSLLLLGAMAVRVRLAEGAWPAYNMPDPKTLGLHNTLTILGIVGSFAAVIIVPILTLTAFLLGQRRVSTRPLALVTVGFLVLFLVIRLDLGGLGNWIGD